MVIDMNEAKLETIAQIQEFLTGTINVSFSIPAEEAALHTFIAAVLRRFSYFSRRKSQRGVLGARQGSCRLNHATFRSMFLTPAALMTASRSGLSVTAAIGVQSRV